MIKDSLMSVICGTREGIRTVCYNCITNDLQKKLYKNLQVTSVFNANAIKRGKL